MLPRLLAADTTQSGVWCPVSGCWLLWRLSCSSCLTMVGAW